MTYITGEGEHTIYAQDESYAQSFLRYVRLELDDIKRSFFKIGFRLNEANRGQYYKELGYETIIDLAEAEFGFKKSTTYGLMQVYSYCKSRDKNASMLEMDKAYEAYNYSQLQEISRLKWGGGERLIKPTDSVAKIKNFVSAWNKDGERSNAKGCETIDDYMRKTGRLTDIQVEPAPAPDLLEMADNTEEIFQISGKIDVEPPAEPAEELTECAEGTEEEQIEESGVTLPREKIIAECMRRDSYKNEIYNKYLTNPTREEFIEFLKKREGTRGGEWWCGGYRYREYSPEKGITLTGPNCQNLIISWSVAAATIKKLIEEKTYRTEDELHLHPDEPAPVNPDWDKPSAPLEEPADIEPPAPTVAKEPMTNRARLEAMTTENFVNALIMRILRIYPLNGKSADFSSTLRVKLTEWLNAQWGN